jgi:hypothetical protein
LAISEIAITAWHGAGVVRIIVITTADRAIIAHQIPITPSDSPIISGDNVGIGGEIKT